MYTDTQEALRNSLWNFMGSMLTASMHEENKAKESVTALVSEELCKFCKNEDETSVDMVATKPMFKSIVWVLEARIKELYSLLEQAPAPAKPTVTANILNAEKLKESLEIFIDKI